MTNEIHDKINSINPNSCYTVNINDSPIYVIIYGIVEFLRKILFLRILVSIFGIANLLIFITSLIGYKIPGISSNPVNLVIAAFCLWMATVSGKNFVLVFFQKQASEERKAAENQFKESKSPYDALDLHIKRLNEYYSINQSQARSSFRWAMLSMLLGFATIISGIWIFYLKSPEPNIFMSSISAATGCVINLVSGMFLYVHNKTQQRSLYYYHQLTQLQRITLATHLVKEHEDLSVQAEARNLVIDKLLTKLSLTPESLDQSNDEKDN